MTSKDAQLVVASLSTGEPNKGQVHHLSNLSDTERNQKYGIGNIDMPSTITAGESVTITFQITIGEIELPTNARLRIAWRWPFDWGDLQTSNSDAPNHLSIKSPEHVQIDTLYEKRGDLNPWHHDIDFHITEGTLQTGDTLHVTCTNWQAPTFTTDDGNFLLLINPDNSNNWMRLTDSPRFTIAPGEAERLVAIAPADGIVGEQTIIRIRALDAWENATPISAPTLQGDGIEIDQPTLNDQFPVWEYPVTWTSPGVHRLQAQANNLTTESNPTRVYTQSPKHRIYWGDLHGGQTEIGCGAGSLDHHYAYARHVAALQYTSQQANDHYVTKAIWDLVREVTPNHNIEGKFLAFLGCEWSPYTKDGGDRNVIYAQDEPRMRRSDRFFTEVNPDPEPDLRQAPEFLDTFKKENVLLNLHVGGRPTNLNYHAPEIEPCFEIHSTHATSEWFIFDAIKRGYKVGITAGTDGVMGRPGACGSGRRVSRNVRNGLTAVYAPTLTQNDLLQAFSNRHCYGTTGARMLLDVSANGHPQGSVITTDRHPDIQIQVDGTAPIERIEILRGTQVISTHHIAQHDPNRIRVLWGGAKEQGTAAAQRLIWDGQLQLIGGTLSDITPIAQQCPLDTVNQKSDTHMTWTSATAGNDMGFTCTLDALPSAALNFTSQPCTFTCTKSQIQNAPMTVNAGLLNAQVQIGPAPTEDSSKSAALSFTDTSPLSGEQAYWVRVTQTDRHRAWSSPIYITT
ncbi:MAG: hypothetical protein HN521_22630 [Candidatus Latescibacteria bacterium]|jgi:hypothetical protein|nr:hypothetical protein [Candidatus Latescibacterota bacterium]